MEVEFVGQPFRRWTNPGSFLAEAIADPGVKRLLVTTAWVRSTGLQSLLPSLQSLRARGGRSELIVGVDLKGTSRQGLVLAGRHFDSIHVVHDPAGRTFHPKAYLALGRDRGYALIGSNNLTAGGLGYNYETALACTFDPVEASGMVGEIRRFARTVTADTAICRKLSPRVLKRLADEGWLADEDTDRRLRSEDRLAERRRTEESGQKPLFSRSSVAKRTTTAPARRRRGAPAHSRRAGAAIATAPDTWSKRLGPGDAQRPPRGHRTRAVRLIPPREAADRPRYFRRVFFGNETWTRERDSEGNLLHVASIEVDCWIDGESLGVRSLRFDYGAHRNVRGRATTLLRWGDLLPVVLERDLTDMFLSIERGPGAYRLNVTRTEPV
jgi:hypothetical protein